MNRLLLVGALAALLLTSGCTTQKDFIPSDEDPDELVAAIVRRGQGEGPPALSATQEVPSHGALGPRVLVKCVEVASIAAMVCAFLGLLFLAGLGGQSRPPAV